jgi:hypothetical protein
MINGLLGQQGGVLLTRDPPCFPFMLPSVYIHDFNLIINNHLPKAFPPLITYMHTVQFKHTVHPARMLGLLPFKKVQVEACHDAMG